MSTKWSKQWPSCPAKAAELKVAMSAAAQDAAVRFLAAGAHEDQEEEATAQALAAEAEAATMVQAEATAKAAAHTTAAALHEAEDWRLQSKEALAKAGAEAKAEEEAVVPPSEPSPKGVLEMAFLAGLPLLSQGSQI